jgi:hypothetical protein
MEHKIFKMICIDRGVAEEVATEIEDMGFFVERHGKRSNKRHKRSSAITEEILLVNVPGEEADLVAIQQKLVELSHDYSGVRLLL